MIEAKACANNLRVVSTIIQPPSGTSRVWLAESQGGLGLRIMRNRAAIIRATLTIEKALPAGTVVTCALARKNHEPSQPQETSASPDRR